LFPATFIEEAVYSTLYVFGIFVKNKVGIAVWIQILVLYSVPLVFISVSVALILFMFSGNKRGYISNASLEVLKKLL
jgi:hypothetical protein